MISIRIKDASLSLNLNDILVFHFQRTSRFFSWIKESPGFCCVAVQRWKFDPSLSLTLLSLLELYCGMLGLQYSPKNKYHSKCLDPWYNLTEELVGHFIKPILGA